MLTDDELKNRVLSLIGGCIDEESGDDIRFIEMYGPVIHVCPDRGPDRYFRVTLTETTSEDCNQFV